jgi:hypothetical protein
MGSDASKECVPPATLPLCRPRTSLLYALAIFYLLIAILLIVMAFCIPNLTITPQVAFGLLGILLFLAALFQILAVGRLSRPAPRVDVIAPAVLVTPV